MSHGVTEFVLAVVASLVATIIGWLIWFMLGRLKSSAKSLRIVRLAFLSLLTGTVAIPVYYGGQSWKTGEAFTAPEFSIAVVALAAQLMTAGYLLYHMTRREAEIQYGEPFPVKVQKPGQVDRTISVRWLRARDAGANSDLSYTNWRTLAEGIGFLRQQIVVCKPMVSPDLYVGVRNVGGAIAALLAGSVGDAKKPVKIIRVGERHEVLDVGCLPSDGEKAGVKTILVVDQEVKSGTSLKNIVSFLETAFPGASIRIAVLAATELTEPIKHIEELRRAGSFEQEPKCLPDFLAFAGEKRVKLVLRDGAHLN